MEARKLKTTIRCEIEVRPIPKAPLIRPDSKKTRRTCLVSPTNLETQTENQWGSPIARISTPTHGVQHMHHKLDNNPNIAHSAPNKLCTNDMRQVRGRQPSEKRTARTENVINSTNRFGNVRKMKLDVFEDKDFDQSTSPATWKVHPQPTNKKHGMKTRITTLNTCIRSRQILKSPKKTILNITPARGHCSL